MKTLSYRQLAFILDIKPVEALEKILYVWSKVYNKEKPFSCDTVKEYLFDKHKNKSVRNDLPESLDIGLLAVHLNLPTLQSSVEDIHNNYLSRPATKRWILCDFPEKELKTKLKDKVKIPPVLVSLLKSEDVKTIENEWAKRYGIGTVEEKEKVEV